jgi:hypothetical protein
VTAPLSKSTALQLARGDGIQANGAQHARVAQLGLGRDDAVGDVVVNGLPSLSASASIHPAPVNYIRLTHAVLLLLDLHDAAILESPLDDIGVVADALDQLGRLERGPPVGELLELDVVPDVRERRLDDGRLHDRRRRRDGGGHCRAKFSVFLGGGD